jgi:hypothetical protein
MGARLKLATPVRLRKGGRLMAVHEIGFLHGVEVAWCHWTDQDISNDAVLPIPVPVTVAKYADAAG